MLFGEYVVLNGSKCLAFPLKFGQTLALEPAEELLWESFAKEERWFHVRLNSDLEIIETNLQDVALILRDLLRIIQQERPELDFQQHFKAVANFNLGWGLGSSSTLISLLSQWSGVSTEILLKASFGGSGYDVACATAKQPIVYVKGGTTEQVSLSPAITEKMLFVYLGNKQNSREEIKRYEKAEVTAAHVEEMNTLIQKALETSDIEVFEEQLNKSEALIAPIIGHEKLKDRLFADYLHSIKSLGAWGGDFFLATVRDMEAAKTYFRNKGYTTLFPYNELIK